MKIENEIYVLMNAAGILIIKANVPIIAIMAFRF